MRQQITTTITQEEMREAILEWYKSKGGSMEGAVTLRFNCVKSSHGQGWGEVDTEAYSAVITRIVPDTDQ
jgi:hypothetical protein